MMAGSLLPYSSAKEDTVLLMVLGRKQELSANHWQPAVAHSLHVSAVCPVADLYFPTVHAEHFVEANCALKVPEGQATTRSLDQNHPIEAKQAVIFVEPVTPPVAELLGHPVHAAEPLAALNVSAPHAVKEPPSGPV
jgi:hypothetical protein